MPAMGSISSPTATSGGLADALALPDAACMASSNAGVAISALASADAGALRSPTITVGDVADASDAPEGGDKNLPARAAGGGALATA